MNEAIAGRLSLALAERYTIERELGQGGMATVFLARDLRHDRRVALKVLRPELAAVIGAERFLQEIRVTAGLQHPHILPLHDSGEADHFLYYVMPFVEGESLRERLIRERQLAVDDAVRIAIEAAGALGYAHRRGVIHRDIKPENILLAGEAAVVADFGIARAVTAAGGGRLTETGLSLGTPQYMSPEQATADRDLDGRSDVYALGCVLYEMLTGEPPHTGPTTQSVIAKLLTETPRPVTASRPTVPPYLAAAVHKALARLPADRFRGAAEFAEALARPGEPGAAPHPPVERTPGIRRWERPQARTLGLAALLFLAAAATLWSLLQPRTEAPAPVIRSVLKLPPGGEVQLLGVGIPLALSPDGASLVYAGARELMVRRLDALEAVPVPGTLGGGQPFFSPDGQQLGFVAGGSLKLVSLAGGPTVTLGPVQGASGATWGTRDTMVFSASGRLFTIAASGGTARPVPQDGDQPVVLRWPDFLPDGRRVLATAGLVPTLSTVIVDLASGKLTPVPDAGAGARFVPPDKLLSIATDGSCILTSFDWRSGRTSGPVTPVLEGVNIGLQGSAVLAVSQNGFAVYAPAVSGGRRLVLVDRGGRQTIIPTGPKPFSDPRFSPAGSEIAVTSLATGRGLQGDIWVVDLRQNTTSRLTFDGRYQFPEWSSDGRQVTFVSITGGMLQAPSTGGGLDTLLSLPQTFEGLLTWDQRMIVYRAGGIPGDLYYVRRDSLRAPHPLLVSSFDERAPALSPDDRWLAYVSNETGRDEVYVRPFPAGAGRWLVSSAGGTEPRWRRDGRELFYRSSDSLFAVPIRLQAGAGFAAGQRALLFTGNFLTNLRHANWDVDREGRRFVFVTGDSEGAAELILVQNLFSPGRIGARR